MTDSLKTTTEVRRMMRRHLKKDESLGPEAPSDPAVQNDPGGPRAVTEAKSALRTERKPGGGASRRLMTRTAGDGERTGPIQMTPTAGRGRRRRGHVLRLAETGSHALIT